MTVETLNLIAMAAFIASGLVFLLSIASFFLLDIPQVVGELTGSTAKKSIQKIQEHNKNYSGKLVHSADPNAHVTKPSKTGRVGVGTEKFKTSTLESKNNARASETTVLTSNETTILTSNSNETTVLINNAAPAAAPTANEVASVPAQTVASAEFEVVESLSEYMDNELIK